MNTKKSKTNNQVGAFLSKLLEENNKNVRNIIREELEYYIENKADNIADMVVEKINKTGNIISESNDSTNNEGAVSVDQAEEMGYDMKEIRKRLSQKYSPVGGNIQETVQGGGNSNKIADDNGNLVEVEENPELDKKLKRDYSNYL